MKKLSRRVFNDLAELETEPLLLRALVEGTSHNYLIGVPRGVPRGYLGRRI